jgi:hypothetical protein
MPKASVNKYGQPGFRKGEVGLSGYSVVSAPTGHAIRTERGQKHRFRGSIAARADGRHHAGSLLLAENIGHGYSLHL